MNERPAAPRRFDTIHDVADEAGVTVGTVSKALNNNGRLRADTRARIQEVAARIGFRPSSLACSLHTRRTLTVGLLSNDSYGRFTTPILQGLETALSPHACRCSCAMPATTATASAAISTR